MGEIQEADDLRLQRLEDGYADNNRQCPESDTGTNVSDFHLYLRSPYGRKEKSDYLCKGRPLYIAARSGNWNEAEKIFKIYPNAKRAYITDGLETPLHISAVANRLNFVTNLVEQLDPQDLAITNKVGNTALCLAAASGNVDIAQVLIQKHLQLGQICGHGGTLPVMMAAILGNKDMVETLLPLLNNTFWRDREDAKLLKELVASGFYDIAWKIIERNPKLAVSDTAVLEMLATKPMAERCKKRIWDTFFGLGTMKEADFQSLELLKNILGCAFKEDDLNIENIVKIAPRLLFDAAEQGNFHFFKWLIYYYPELVWKTNTNGVSMFHIAVQHRHESIFALLHEMDEVRRLVTTYVHNETGDNMLHLAATLASKDKLNTVTGAAFQMQQAICWYKAVEKIVPPACKNMENKNRSKPADIFDQNQEKLLKEGEKWIKATAKSCMLVAALTATVMFTSAFTVPGGNDNEGHPYLLNKVCFQFLTVSEVIGMLSSSTSILMFLSILTTRVNKYAFQRSLPRKLMIGVTTLFVSIASMVVAFCTTIYLSYGHKWVPGLLLLFSCVPVMFISLKFRLLADLVCSTFVSRFLFRSSNLSNS